MNNSTDCATCMQNAICEGGFNVRVVSGYWRSSNESIHILKCLNPVACPGGFGGTENGASPCATGYGGNLCDECITDADGNKYERITGHQCSKCPEKSVNAIRIVGLSVLVLACVLLLVL